jgi:NRPS condensation-like uncharacterized protein
MAKAVALTLDALNAPQITPKAATPARSSVSAPAAQEEGRGRKKKPEPMFPLQIRIPKEDLKAIKIAATGKEQTVSDFMLACFHAYMKP